MSSRQPDESPSVPEPKKSNTALIVIIVLAVLTIPALCICSGVVGIMLLWSTEGSYPLERIIKVAPLDPSIELVPEEKTVPPPIEAVPPVKSAPEEKPLSGDEATNK